MKTRHRVDRYARDITSGRMVAGPYVRLACARHLRDLEQAAQKGFWFDATAADHAMRFIERWVRLPDTTGEDGQAKPFILESWQAFIIGSIFGWRWRESGYRRFRNGYMEIGKGSGKALAVDTPIPTVDGWKSMGDIVVGDVVFDERGRQTRVIGAFDVMLGHPCYRVAFDDGSSIVADADHLWFTERRKYGQVSNSAALRGVPLQSRGAWRKCIRTTTEIAHTLRYRNGAYQSANHSIPLAGPLGRCAKPLPISPYVLGVWLGDGDSDCARVTVDDADVELLEHVVATGGSVGARVQSILSPRTPRYAIRGGDHEPLAPALRQLGLIRDKHIPEMYLCGSVEQRLELLQGLMDTDGYISPLNGCCEFTSTVERLARGVEELVISLGVKCRLRESVARLAGRVVSKLWRLQFCPPVDLPVFRLRRKSRHQVMRHARRRLAGDRRIVACESVESVPVRCIAVDAPSHLYLAGRSMVPTHNTPMLAAIGLYGLLMDGQKAPEIYAAAADRDQAMIMYRDAVRMAQASPELSSRLRFSGIEHVYNMAYGLGFFRPFSREQGAKSGTRPHMGLIDELHEHPNGEVVNKIRAGAKGNMDALFLEITNSGFDRTSICYQHHEHSVRIVQQVVEDERWFSYVCALDVDDDPLVSEACWLKVNPNLGVSIQPEYLRDQVSAAKHIPGETNTVLRLNFCIWTQAHTRFIPVERWIACGGRVSAEALVGARCFAGLDLGQSDDFTAFVRVWQLADGRCWVVPKFWMPNAAKERWPNRSYAEWERANALEIIDSEVIDYGLVESQVLKLCQESHVIEVSYDQKFAEQMAQNLTAAGVTMVNTSQGFQLTEALRKLSDVVLSQQLVHDANPIMTVMMDNLVVRHGRNGEIRPDKDRSADKIDGQVALVMALDAIVRQTKTPAPTYQMFFLGAKS